jgi:Uma2 family endonuclease
MATDTVAPWAETAPLTSEILQHMPDDGWRYELVQGRLVRMPPTGYEHGRISAILASQLQRFIELHPLGDVLGAETGFILSREGEPDTVLAPDAAFVSSQRSPARDATGFARLAPDLVVEVVSPGQTRSQMEAKARLYLAAGVRLIWIVWPDSRTVDVWRAGEDIGTPFTEDDDLTGENVLPGLTIAVRDIFA